MEINEYKVDGASFSEETQRIIRERAEGRMQIMSSDPPSWARTLWEQSYPRLFERGNNVHISNLLEGGATFEPLFNKSDNDVRASFNDYEVDVSTPRGLNTDYLTLDNDYTANRIRERLLNNLRRLDQKAIDAIMNSTMENYRGYQPMYERNHINTSVNYGLHQMSLRQQYTGRGIFQQETLIGHIDTSRIYIGADVVEEHSKGMIAVMLSGERGHYFRQAEVGTIQNPITADVLEALVESYKDTRIEVNRTKHIVAGFGGMVYITNHHSVEATIDYGIYPPMHYNCRSGFEIKVKSDNGYLIPFDYEPSIDETTKEEIRSIAKSVYSKSDLKLSYLQVELLNRVPHIEANNLLDKVIKLKLL